MRKKGEDNIKLSGRNYYPLDELMISLLASKVNPFAVVGDVNSIV
jgi:hypothetical protein